MCIRDSRERVRQWFAQHFKPGEEDALSRRFEGKVLHRSGAELPAEFAVTCCRMGDQVFLTAFVRDITERKQMESALLSSETTYRLISRASNDAIWDWELARNRITWNDGIRTVFGYPPEMVGEKPDWWLERIHADDRARVGRDIQDAIRGGQFVWSDQYRFRRHDGVDVEVMDRGFIVHDENRKPVRMVGAMLDVSALKRTEKDLKRAVQARDELVAVISHELKNPLTAISTSVEIMAKKLSGDETGKLFGKLLSGITVSIHRMGRLIFSLLDITRIEGGKLGVDIKGWSVREIVNEVVESIDPVAREKSTRLSVDISPEVGQIHCDRDRVGQVLVNLVDNAVKFAPRGAVVVAAKLVEGSQIEFEVRDTGPGIPEDYQAHVFDRFWQAKNTAYQGTGLGLSIAKGIVEAHGGKIWFKSEVGRGTSFFFSLPVYPSQEELAA